MGGWWRWALVSPDGVVPRRMVSVSASVNLPLHHKVQKFFSGTGSPGWFQKKGRKTVVSVLPSPMSSTLNLQTFVTCEGTRVNSGRAKDWHLSFAVDDDALLFRLLLLAFILRNSVQEVLATAWVLYVLHADVDPLGQDASSVNSATGDDTNGLTPV